MYEDLNCFEEALKHFGTRVDVYCSLQLGGKMTAEEAYQKIKDELKEMKSYRKKWKKDPDFLYEDSNF